MKPYLNLCMLLLYALFCTASIIPRRTRSSDITPYLHSFGIPLTARQDTSCLSEEECGEGNLCAQLFGELFCKSDCEGFCVPEEARDSFCNCNQPCKIGVCTDPLPGSEQPDNGLCAPGKDRKAFKCAGKKEDKDDVGEVVSDEEDVDKPGINDEKKDPAEPNGPEMERKPKEVKPDDAKSDGDDPETDAKDVLDETDPATGEGEVEVGKPGMMGEEEESGKTGEEQKPGKTEEEKSPDDSGSGTESKPKPGKAEQPSSSPDTETPSPRPETPSPQPEAGTSESTEEESSAVCISREHLRHLDASRLVFRNDVLARVLCDTSGSCATAGHMIVFRGQGMMMSRYCEKVGCVERVMWVNSPLYETGLRVESRSSDLSFTALAARFGTVAEEVVLRAAVRFGM